LGVMRLPAVTLGLFRTFSLYPFFGFFVDSLMSCGEDFGKVGEVEVFDEGESDCAFVALRPSFERTNQCLNHCRRAFILEVDAASHTEKGDAFFPRPFHDEAQR
jgi:hypothetical protein